MTPSVSARLLACILFLGAARAVSAAVVVNDVRPWSGGTGVTDSYPSQVTLYNTGPSAVSLSGGELRAAGDIAFSVSLPAWTVPPGAYVIVNFGTGAYDDVFAGDSTAIYSVDPGATLQTEAGEVGLYIGGVQSDFVSWGEDSTSLGAAYFDAVTAMPAGWTPGGYVSLAGVAPTSHLQRVPSGYDTNVPADWQIATISYFLPPVLHTHNDMQIAPANGELLDATTVDFAWRAVHDAASYHLQVARDSSFDSLVVDVSVPGTAYAGVALPGDALCFWRVVPDLAGGPYPASIWQFTTASSDGSRFGITAAPTPQAAVTQAYQHKDSPLLCDWNLIQQRIGGVLAQKVFRPACREAVSALTQSGPWDAPHSTNADHIKACRHCNMYCVRASFQMVNAKYSGSLTQDEISYRLWRVANPGPEGDLGHGTGGNADSMLAVLRWALSNNMAIRSEPLPSLDSMRTEILAGRPVICCINTRHARWSPAETESHCVVFDGYEEKMLKTPRRIGVTPQGRAIFDTLVVTKHWFHLVDPIPGGTKWYDVSDLGGTLTFYLHVTPAGRASNPLIRVNQTWTDSDGDGMLDFDEGLTTMGALDPARRNFECRADRADTDGDGIGDKQEVRSYTFHNADHALHPLPPALPGEHPNATQRLTFANVDGDGLRAERDTDTDGDFRDDGVEDCNRNGKGPEGSPVPACRAGGETCMYDPRDPVNRFGPAPRGLKCISLYPRSPAEGGAWESTGAPLLDGGTVSFPLVVDEHWTILDLNVELGISHTRDQDLVVHLISPAGDVIELTSGNGGDGDNYTGTLFDDEASASIAEGAAPFDGPARPETPLWMVEGEDAYGVWTLQVTDTAPGETGSLDSLCLDIQHDEPDGTRAGGGGESPDATPHALRLALSPNPAHSQARLVAALPRSGDTRIDVFDIAGRHVTTVAHGWMTAGVHRLRWNGDDAEGRAAGGGVYFVRVQQGREARVERVTLAR